MGTTRRFDSRFRIDSTAPFSSIDLTTRKPDRHSGWNKTNVIREVCRYTEERSDAPVKLEDRATQAGISPAH
jgi:hypothetical protein